MKEAKVILIIFVSILSIIYGTVSLAVDYPFQIITNETTNGIQPQTQNQENQPIPFVQN